MRREVPHVHAGIASNSVWGTGGRGFKSRRSDQNGLDRAARRRAFCEAELFWATEVARVCVVVSAGVVQPTLGHMKNPSSRTWTVIAITGLVLVALTGWFAATRSRPDAGWQAAVNTSNTTKTGKTGKAAPKGQAGTIAVEAARARAAKTTTDIRGIGSLLSDEFVQITTEIAAGSPISASRKAKRSAPATSSEARRPVGPSRARRCPGPLRAGQIELRPRQATLALRQRHREGDRRGDSGDRRPVGARVAESAPARSIPSLRRSPVKPAFARFAGAFVESARRS